MNYAVIGLGFGDESKGVITDYICSKNLNSLDTRFSGGQQAGHTVVLDGVRHVFSNFGSGSLRGIPTYWSRFCTVDPQGIMAEYKILREKGISPVLYIDYACPVTTPYEKAFNQQDAINLKNGTCGVGVGKTFQREEDFFSLTYADLFYPRILKIKLNNIRKEYYKYNKNLEEEIQKFLEAAEFVTSTFNCVDHLPLGFSNYVFESSQGLMLDQNIGFFPNVTRSSVGSKNILQIVNDFEPWLVTRAYQTRHGSGPMTQFGLPFEDANFLIKGIEETNVTNQYQGIFRASILDLDLINYAIGKDPYLSEHRYKCNFVLSCIDHLREDAYAYAYKGMICHYEDANSFVQGVMRDLNLAKMYINNSPESKSIKKVQL